MASSILTGDRRWASARKSSLTVLGKVPKPINLPSQRLENNGVDPNVEIVPKGTLTWGQRPSSAIPNAWNSSTLLSPKTDGSAGSPSHGRPSSGGGVRPSTAGSDKSQDPPFSAWGPNSRPSSASGLLPSSQTPTVTRPQSAETRPVNSHLSRFAENSAESAVAWGATRTVENLMTSSSKNDDFNLTPNDFPTLGSEKTSEINLQRGHTSQVRPSSASGPDERPKENMKRPMSGDGYVGTLPCYGNISVSRTEKYLHAEDPGQPSMKCQNEHQQTPPYSSISVTSNHFESWRSPPVQPTDGILYRGATGCPSGPVGPAASYPVDPFGYFPPHFHASSESVPRPGTGNVGYRPTNGELYRPQLHPNSYVIPAHAVITGRPGTYQGPVPYDSYHNNHHQGNFSSPSEQQFPFVGVASRPVMYNQYGNMRANINSGQFQNKPVVHNPPLSKELMLSEKAQSSQQTQYKVLTRQHDVCDDNTSPVAKDQNVTSLLNGRKITGCPKLEGEPPMDVKKNEMRDCLNLETNHQISMQPTSDQKKHLSIITTSNFEENSSKITYGILSKPDSAIESLCAQPQQPTMKKHISLIEKIEGLNNKARGVDSHREAGRPVRQDKSLQQKVPDTKSDPSMKVNYSGAVSSRNDPPISDKSVPSSLGIGSSNISNRTKLSNNPTAWRGSSDSQVISSSAEVMKPAEVRHQHIKRKPYTTGRMDNNAKLTSEGTDDNEKVMSSERNLLSTDKTGVESGLTDGVPDSQFSKELYVATIPGSSSSSESLDHKARRFKLKEIAAQRAKQLQEEEEERTREQKAKALAKLEELNRRAASLSLKQNPSNASSIPTDNTQQQEVREIVTSIKTNVITSDASVSVNSDQVKQTRDDGMRNLRESVALTITEPKSRKIESLHESVLSSSQDRRATEGASGENNFGSHCHDNTSNKLKQVGYRRKQVSQEESSCETITTEKTEVLIKSTYIWQEKNKDDGPISADNTINIKNHTEDTVAALNRVKLACSDDSFVRSKKKNNRNSRNKSKIDEIFVGSNLITSVQYTENIKEHSSAIPKTDHVSSAAELILTSTEGSVVTCESQVSKDVPVALSEEGSATANQEAHGSLNSHWKPQPPRKSSRYQQGVRPADKFHGGENVIWAPVKVKNEQSEEGSQIISSESKPQSSPKSEDALNGTKLRRAEIERYVPKPVAKELAQQENPRPPASSICYSKSGDYEKSCLDSTKPEMDRLDSSSVVNIADAKTDDDKKPNRRNRSHTSWKQRSSSESTIPPQGSNETLVTHATKLSKKASDLQLPLNLERLPEEKTKPDVLGVNNNPAPSEPEILPSAVKDQQGAAVRQKRQQTKVHKVQANTYAPASGKIFQSGTYNSDVVSLAFDPSEPDVRKSEIKDSGHEHPRTRWKPKSVHYSHNNQPINRSNVGQGDGSCIVATGNDISAQGIMNQSLTQKDPTHDFNNVGQVVKVSSGIHQKEHTYTPKQGPLSNSGMDQINEKQASTASCQHGPTSGHFNRGPEATYRARDQGQDLEKQNGQTNGEKKKNNIRYEYQCIDSYNKPSYPYNLNANIGQEAQNVHDTVGWRYRERGNAQPRRNGQYIRRSGGSASHASDSLNGGG